MAISFAALAPSLVNGAFGLASSFLGAKSQRDANRTNMHIAMMNNDWSERMMEKQHLYDVEMWNKNNEYNDPSKQVERLKAAGINPALALGNVGTGTAQGGNSVGLPSPSTPQIQPLRYDGFTQAISNTVQTYMAMSRNDAEISALGSRVDNETALARARIAQMMEETRNTRFRNELNDITKDLQIQHQNEDFLRKVQERSNMEEQQKLIQQQVIAQELINQNLPEKLAMEVAVMASTRDLNKFNAQSEAGKFVQTLKKRGYKLTDSEEKAIFDAFKRTIFMNSNPSSLSQWISRLGTGGYATQGHYE